MRRADIEDVELELFVQGLLLRHGYDMSQYTRASLKRRVQALATREGFDSVGALTARMLRDDAFLPQVIAGLSVPVSDMFRDPPVFRALREHVFPLLASYPQVNIWQAGCAYGEEVYSLAILLEEAGLYDRCQIYATDFSESALERAREGIFPTRDARTFAENYQAAGGSRTLADYYVAAYEHIKLDDRLKRNIAFIHHNLATDGVFNEAHLVLCRNVLIYFATPLQNRVLTLFRDSLVRGGFLCLGLKENLEFAPAARDFIPFQAKQRIYRLSSRVP